MIKDLLKNAFCWARRNYDIDFAEGNHWHDCLDDDETPISDEELAGIHLLENQQEISVQPLEGWKEKAEAEAIERFKPHPEPNEYSYPNSAIKLFRAESFMQGAQWAVENLLPVKECWVAEPIPEWIIKYDQAGHQSSAGKAIRYLMKRLEQVTLIDGGGKDLEPSK
jgi:hypothetical protein